MPRLERYARLLLSYFEARGKGECFMNGVAVSYVRYVCRIENTFLNSLSIFSVFMNALNLPFRCGYSSIDPCGSQRPQNRRLKHS